MEPLTIITWWWGDKYGAEYVDRLRWGLARHIKQMHTFLVIRPDPAEPLLRQPGCLVRLRMFDPDWQKQHGIAGRLVCIDLDVVITGALDSLFDRPEPFVILQGANSINPCPYNGSLMMLRTGHHADVWAAFNFVKVREIKYFKFPDDQGWIWHKLPNAAGWQVGAASGIWSFRKRGWPGNDDLPPKARMVCFPGDNDPSKVEWLPWIKQHWQ